MTREKFETKWQDMTPRERDAWVAEEVMGYSIYRYDKSRPENNYYCLVDEHYDAVTKECGLHAGERKTEEEAWNDCPNFTEDISSAMEILDKFESLGYSIVLKSGWPGNEWICDIGEAHAWGHTKMEAICKTGIKAALKAVL